MTKELNDDGETQLQLDAAAENQLARIEDSSSDLKIELHGIQSRIDRAKDEAKGAQAEAKRLSSAGDIEKAKAEQKKLRDLRDTGNNLKVIKVTLNQRMGELSNE